MSLKYLISAALAAVVASIAVPALAEGSIGAGVYGSGGNLNATGGGVLLGTGASVPIVPVSVGVTGFAPLAKGGGYAVTLDGKLAYGSDAFGAGYGIGQFGGAPSGGTITAFYDHKLAPFTAIELRGYHTVTNGGGNAGLLALKFSI